jgi:hypothetical protein
MGPRLPDNRSVFNTDWEFVMASKFWTIRVAATLALLASVAFAAEKTSEVRAVAQPSGLPIKL